MAGGARAAAGDGRAGPGPTAAGDSGAGLGPTTAGDGYVGQGATAARGELARHARPQAAAAGRDG
jgi:hypothetical protein